MERCVRRDQVTYVAQRFPRHQQSRSAAGGDASHVFRGCVCGGMTEGEKQWGYEPTSPQSTMGEMSHWVTTPREAATIFFFPLDLHTRNSHSDLMSRSHAEIGLVLIRWQSKPLTQCKENQFGISSSKTWLSVADCEDFLKHTLWRLKISSFSRFSNTIFPILFYIL